MVIYKDKPRLIRYERGDFALVFKPVSSIDSEAVFMAFWDKWRAQKTDGAMPEEYYKEAGYNQLLTASKHLVKIEGVKVDDCEELQSIADFDQQTAFDYLLQCIDCDEFSDLKSFITELCAGKKKVS